MRLSASALFTGKAGGARQNETLASVRHPQTPLSDPSFGQTPTNPLITTPNSECRGSLALCYIDCCNLPGKCTTYSCLICCCAALQYSFISRVQSARLLPESDNNSTSNFFKTYSNTQTQHSYSKFRMQGFFLLFVRYSAA